MIDTVIKGFFTGFWKELKIVPHTAISTLMIWGVLWFSYFYILPGVSATEAKVVQYEAEQKVTQQTMSNLARTIQKLNARLIKEDMERDLASMEKESTEIERDVERLQRLQQEVPSAMINRLQELRIRKQRLNREISAFVQEHPELMERNL